MKVNDWLLEKGWTEPLDESPFDIPEGWSGGSVQNTGGNIYCRIWRNEEARIEVIYGLDHKTVSAYFLEDTEYGLITQGVELRLKEAKVVSDEAKMSVAEELINRFTHE